MQTTEIISIIHRVNFYDFTCSDRAGHIYRVYHTFHKQCLIECIPVARRVRVLDFHNFLFCFWFSADKHNCGRGKLHVIFRELMRMRTPPFAVVNFSLEIDKYWKRRRKSVHFALQFYKILLFFFLRHTAHTTHPHDRDPFHLNIFFLRFRKNWFYSCIEMEMHLFRLFLHFSFCIDGEI